MNPAQYDTSRTRTYTSSRTRITILPKVDCSPPDVSIEEADRINDRRRDRHLYGVPSERSGAPSQGSSMLTTIKRIIYTSNTGPHRQHLLHPRSRTEPIPARKHGANNINTHSNKAQYQAGDSGMGHHSRALFMS